MPLEVNEIGIHMRVGSSADHANCSPHDKKQSDPCRQGSLDSEERDALIEDCVRRVLQVLQSRQER